MKQDTPDQTIGAEVVQAAIQMEELGRDFYAAFGGVTNNPRILELCRKLAVDEANHRDIFRGIQSDLARQGKTVLLSDEQTAEARRMVKKAIVPDPETVRRVVSTGNVADFFAMGVQIETDAVQFYSMFAKGLPEGNAVEAIIQEERQHLAALTAASRREKTNP